MYHRNEVKNLYFPRFDILMKIRVSGVDNRLICEMSVLSENLFAEK